MENSKLVNYLRHLKPGKVRRFKNFVESPYFNKRNKSIELLAILLEEIGKNDSKLDKRAISEKLFDSKSVKIQMLHNEVSFLLRLFSKFCAIEKFETQKWEKQLTTLEASQQDHQPKLFELTAQQIATGLNKDKEVGASSSYARYRYYSVLANQQKKENTSENKAPVLQTASDHLDLFYITEKLRLICSMLAEKEVTSREYKLSFLNDFIDALETNPIYVSHPAIQIYYCIYNMLQSPGEESFYTQLTDQMAQHLSFFSKKDGLGILSHAQNFCVRQINLGNLIYLEELHQLYQKALENELLIINNQFNQWTFLNIVSVGCRLKKYTWTINFLEKYKSLLSEKDRSNAYNYNLAFYHYSKGEYETSMHLLSTVEFSGFFYQFNARIILLKTYFASQEWLPLEYMLESFRIFLLRSKQIGTYHRKNNLTLIRFVKKLSKLKANQGLLRKKDFTKKIETLRVSIETQENLSNKNWLLKQCGT